MKRNMNGNGFPELDRRGFLKLAGAATGVAIASSATSALATNTRKVARAGQGGTTRHYYIAAEHCIWDYAPGGVDRITERVPKMAPQAQSAMSAQHETYRGREGRYIAIPWIHGAASVIFCKGRVVSRVRFQPHHHQEQDQWRDQA